MRNEELVMDAHNIIIVRMMLYSVIARAVRLVAISSLYFVILSAAKDLLEADKRQC
jgi:hypothetical protein